MSAQALDHRSPCSEGTRNHYKPLTSCEAEVLDSATGSINCAMEVPAKKDLTRVSANFGLCKGTSCPAPLTVTNVNPSYICVHPPTYFKNHNNFQLP
ncbi:hypothetical protein Hanom_Chr06g00517141 [Helianthus anomalus]